MSEPVNIVIDHIDEKSVAEYLSLIEDMLIEAGLVNKSLKEENEKLRKFATRLLRQSLEHTSNVITRDILTDEARELGVEVEG